MKKILFMLPILATAFVSCDKDKGDELSGDDIIQFNDANFLEYLLNVKGMELFDLSEWEWTINLTANYDKNNDRQISVKEASEITALSFSDSYDANGEYINTDGITNIDEIRYFTNLVYLYNLYNVSSIDISNNIKLRHFMIEESNLSSLDVSKNTELVLLDCLDNQIADINVSNNTKLQYLLLGSNKLTKIDVSNNPALIELSCEDNQLTTLDLSNNNSLEMVWCSGNPLQTLTISASQQNASWLNDVKTEYPDIEIIVK